MTLTREHDTFYQMIKGNPIPRTRSDSNFDEHYDRAIHPRSLAIIRQTTDPLEIVFGSKDYMIVVIVP